MIASLFGQLGTRIFGGLSIVLLIAMGLQTERLSACQRSRAKVEVQLSDANATIRQFQATGERIEAERADAVKAAKAEQSGIRTKIERIVIPTPVAGCDTPPEVMEAFK